MGLIIVYALALLTGLLLGLLGGGGSVCTIIIFIYLLKLPPAEAGAYSLFVIGITSSIAGWDAWRKKQVDRSAVLLFGIFSLAAVFIARKYIITFIPPRSGWIIQVILSVFMAAAAASLLCSHKRVTVDPPVKLPDLLLTSFGTGLLTGLTGAGGGFLVVPVLRLFFRLSLPVATGSSLVIIAITSAGGFLTAVARTDFDYPLLLSFTACTVTGCLAGRHFVKHFNQTILQQVLAFLLFGASLLLLFVHQ